MKKNDPQHVCLTRTGQERFLLSELQQFPGSIECTGLGAHLVGVSGVPAEAFSRFPLYFACQFIPDAMQVSAPSITSWAQELLAIVSDQLDDSGTPWALHVLEPSTAQTGKVHSRARLVRAELLALLKRKRRSLSRALVEGPSPEAVLVQAVLASPTDGFVSFASPKTRRALGPIISRWPAGYAAVPDDPNPPSRAFKKLREAIHAFSLPFSPEMSCVDLGASPGGWTHVLLDQRCKVTAIDRSPLAPGLMRSRSVQFIKGDALSWAPEACVDWMVCDVITTPPRTASLIERWVTRQLCKRLLVTVKFKGTPDFSALGSIRSLLDSHCAAFGARQLTNNKNEVTVFGELRL